MDQTNKYLMTHQAAGAPKDQTLGDVLVVLEHLADINRNHRRAMISAVRSFCRVLGEEPSSVSATPAHLRKRIETVHWQATGLSRSYVSTMKGWVLSALKAAGVPIMRSRETAPRSPAWEALKSSITDEAIWSPLSRFSGYCTDQEIEPADVDETVLVAFEAALRELSIKTDPARRARQMRWAWSKAVLEIEGAAACLPPATKHTRRYALAWEALPSSFAADVDAFTAARSTFNPFALDYCKPVAASTAVVRRKQILQLASALVFSGFPVADLVSLSVLVQAENAEAALQYLFARAGSKGSPYLGQQAQLTATIAKHWVKAPPATIQRLAELTANLRIKKSGMVAKNRQRLRQFDLETNVDLLLALPSKTLHRLARKTEHSANDLASGAYAMAVAILLRIPIRVTNLCHLELGSQVKTMRHGAAEVVHLLIPQTKNGDPYEAPLPPDVVRLLKTYLKVVRPKITDTPSNWLFPNQRGERRHQIAFSRELEAFIEREIGLTVNAHLFRHFAMLMQHRLNPGDRETPRQLLGHRSSATTEGAYMAMDVAGAARRHDALISRLRHRHAPATSEE